MEQLARALTSLVQVLLLWVRGVAAGTWPAARKRSMAAPCTRRTKDGGDGAWWPFWVDAAAQQCMQQQRRLFGARFASLGCRGSDGADSSDGSRLHTAGQHASRQQFPQAAGLVYLDHAAATLPALQQLQDAHGEQCALLFANPHSQLPQGLDHTAAAERELRQLTLDMLHAPASEYEVILTSGATAALKLAGEAFPWTRGSSCALLNINHNSALGVCRLAAAAGAAVDTVPVDQLLMQRQQQQQQQQTQLQPAGNMRQQQQQPVHSLFVVPAECNFSGTKYDCGQLLHTWQQVCAARHSKQQQQQQQQQAPQLQQWLLLVDAAKACASHPTDLSACPADMLALSYYKVFGHPTGLGALVVRRSLLPLLSQHKAYFGGGTVEVMAPDRCHAVRRAGAAGLEDGTLPFTAVAAARHGFRQLARVGGFACMRPHMARLTWHLMAQLLQLRHRNGQRAAVLYCSPGVQQLLQAHVGGAAARHTSGSAGSHLASKLVSTESAPSGGTAGAAALPPPLPAGVLQAFAELQGPVVAFNLLRPDGSWVGHKEVARLAAIHHICLRTGCFCNPGACAHYLGLSSEELLAHHAAGHVCWDDHDVIDGKPTGAVRASLGYMSSFEDVALLLLFLQRFFVAGDDAGGDRGTSSCRVAGRVRQGGSSAGVAVAANGHSKAGAAAAATAAGTAAGAGVGRLAGLYLYPVKSCAPQQVTAWPLGPNGLLFDREWALCGADGRVLSQKRAPRLTQLRPHVDLQQRVLRLSAPRLPQQLVVLLDAGDAEHCCSSSSSSSGGAAAAAAASSCASAGRCRHQQQLAEAQQEQVISVCGQRVSTQAVPAAVVVASAAASHDDSSGSSSSSSSGTVATAGSAEQWLLQAVGVPCRLVRQIHSSRTVKQCHQQQQPSQQQQDCQAGPTHGTAQSLGFANEGQFLLVNQRSVEYVATRLLHTAAALRQTDRAAADGDSSSSSGGGSSGGKQQAVAAAGVLDALRFRPNLVVSGFEPWAEDSWSAVVVGGPLQQQQQQQQKEAQQLRPRGAVLSVIGACGRCDMVAIDQRTGQRQGSQLLSLLAQERRAGGKLQFGVLLALGAPCGAPAAREQWLRIGDCVQPVAAADTGAYM